MKQTTTLLGARDLEKMSSDPSCGWISEKTAYTGDSAITNLLASKLKEKNYTWKVYAGCWCGDTKKLLPLFRSVMESASFPENRIQYYFLDLNKKSPEGDEVKDGIEYVPVFILYLDGKEKGRIVEKISQSMESALLSLLLLS